MTERAADRLAALTAARSPDADDAGTLRRRALAAAAQAYSAAHGHPTERATPGPVRWAVSGRTAAAVVLVLVVLGGALMLRAWATAPEVHVTLDPVPAEVAVPDAPTGEEATAGESLVVHVVGEVAAPGVVHLPPGSRVADAVEAAGGATAIAELGALNLARPVTDGEQVRVPAPGEAGEVAAAEGAVAEGAAGDGRVDLNTATAAELEALPGIGPVLAERILARRQTGGPFTLVAELAEVSGIGPALLADLEPLVTVG